MSTARSTIKSFFQVFSLACRYSRSLHDALADDTGTMADYEPRGITVRDVAAADFIKAYAEHLKNTGRVELPSWCDLVKTAPHKEMCPYDQDWYYIRAGERYQQQQLQQRQTGTNGRGGRDCGGIQ